jgi:hypothetical protein
VPKLVVLRPDKGANDIGRALRAIADDVDAGVYGMLTTCAVVIGHTYERENPGTDYSAVAERWTSFGIGPRHDPFTIKGLLITAIGDLSGTIVPDEPEPSPEQGEAADEQPE